MKEALRCVNLDDKGLKELELGSPGRGLDVFETLIGLLPASQVLAILPSPLATRRLDLTLPCCAEEASSVLRGILTSRVCEWGGWNLECKSCKSLPSFPQLCQSESAWSQKPWLLFHLWGYSEVLADQRGLWHLFWPLTEAAWLFYLPMVGEAFTLARWGGGQKWEREAWGIILSISHQSTTPT